MMSWQPNIQGLGELLFEKKVLMRGSCGIFISLPRNRVSTVSVLQGELPIEIPVEGHWDGVMRGDELFKSQELQQHFLNGDLLTLVCEGYKGQIKIIDPPNYKEKTVEFEGNSKLEKLPDEG